MKFSFTESTPTPIDRYFTHTHMHIIHAQIYGESIGINAHADYGNRIGFGKLMMHTHTHTHTHTQRTRAYTHRHKYLHKRTHTPILQKHSIVKANIQLEQLIQCWRI